MQWSVVCAIYFQIIIFCAQIIYPIVLYLLVFCEYCNLHNFYIDWYATGKNVSDTEFECLICFIV